MAKTKLEIEIFKLKKELAKIKRKNEVLELEIEEINAMDNRIQELNDIEIAEMKQKCHKLRMKLETTKANMVTILSTFELEESCLGFAL